MKAAAKDFETQISQLMASAGVPGLSIFVAREGERYTRGFGIRNRQTSERVYSQTVFEAASLSKPVVAHVALQLVDAGILDLDTPLSQFVGPLVADDPLAARITTRHVLAHTAGLPNWRRDDYPLRTYFQPGSRFSYSGEGFVYLQSALERLTGEPLEVVVQRLVIEPLGMNSSSFVWRDSFNGNVAFGHDDEGNAGAKFKPDRANAAYSLHTTARDYGRFVVAAMEGTLLSQNTGRVWMEPQVATPKARIEALDSTSPETEAGVSWGLGWGLEPEVGAFFHWGANPGARAFVMGIPKQRTAFVAFMNSDTGLDVVPGIVEHVTQGQHPALSWLGLS
ncbi:serine hydrolase domain-containing protein [Ensifer sp. LBL]|uniref:serine hydrolase domain-containing protein n=1 Tax=Ensifer sp. LBL TaxID=2991056 RepID=UPI003D1901AB